MSSKLANSLTYKKHAPQIDKSSCVCVLKFQNIYHDAKITGNDAKEEQTVVESREDSEQGAARVCESR